MPFARFYGVDKLLGPENATLNGESLAGTTPFPAPS